MKKTHSEAFGQESNMPSTSGSESQFINAVFFCENAKLLGEHVSSPSSAVPEGSESILACLSNIFFCAS